VLLACASARPSWVPPCGRRSPRLGVIYGVLNLGNGLGGGLGPCFGGVVHDVTGSYRIAFLAALAFSGCGAACFWLARRPAP
jgi:MFS family permease